MCGCPLLFAREVSTLPSRQTANRNVRCRRLFFASWLLHFLWFHLRLFFLLFFYNIIK
jgi:hypothetical protein